MKVLHIVCGIIQQNNTFIIARRGPGVHENIWEFPGGKVENNESFEEAIIREIKEELAIQISVIKHIKTIKDQRADVLLIVHAYVCHWLKGEISLCSHHEWRRVTASELYDYHFEEADLPIIKAIQTIKF